MEGGDGGVLSDECTSNVGGRREKRRSQHGKRGKRDGERVTETKKDDEKRKESGIERHAQPRQ